MIYNEIGPSKKKKNTRVDTQLREGVINTVTNYWQIFHVFTVFVWAHTRRNDTVGISCYFSITPSNTARTTF